jgi:transcriptional regulator with XRE-family HTH domain
MALTPKEREKLLTAFGEFIQKRRKELGLSQEEVSRKAGYKMNMANSWEQGTRVKMSQMEFDNIANTLGLSEEEMAPYKLLVSGIDRADYTATKDIVIQSSLLKLIEMQNITQADFARSLGVQPPHVSAWLAGRAEPKIGHLKKMVSLYFPITLQAEAMEFLLYGGSYPVRSNKQQAELWKKKYEDLKKEKETV